MLLPDGGEMFLEGGDDSSGKYCDSILGSFPVTDGDFQLLEVKILDSEPEAFLESESGPVEQHGHDPVKSVKLEEDRFGFGFGEDDGEAFGFFRSDNVLEPFEGLFEDFAIEEQEGGEGLVLGAGRDISFDGQVGKEPFDILAAEFTGVSFVVIQNKSSDPGDVLFLGARGMVFQAKAVSDLIEQFWGVRLFVRFGMRLVHGGDFAGGSERVRSAGGE